ncbi:MAG: FAD-binding oxidoreductase, partial [Thermodesulfobacteriota bacterium]|nr:FAD-binding oxidoreductase [Thermodesulfobacteriota bacterium]
MSITKEAYEALEFVVGSDFITRDPAICEAYTRRGFDKETGLGEFLSKTPECIILPGSTREVQEIVKICNRYKIPFVPAGSYWMIHCQPKFPGCVLLDMKRMDELVIDEKNMYAIVGPGLIYSPLQEKAMRAGLYTVVPGGGSQAAVIPNILHWGLSPLGYRVGWANRRILGAEWVLPNGELLRLGSLSMGDNPFWGEGAGPDLRGLLRGWVGWNGGLGIVTRMATKLVPFQPERLKPAGISPNTALDLPSNRVKWYNYRLSSHDDLVKAMYEIGRAGIAAGITRVPIMWRYIAKAKSREQFWEGWKEKGKEEEVKNTHILRILLIGYTSEDQLKYEERVMDDIMSELGAQQLRTRDTDASWFKNTDAVSMWFMTGGFCSVIGLVETISCAVKARENF